MDAPLATAPLSHETPRPAPVPSPTPRAPELPDVAANVRGAHGIAYDRMMLRSSGSPPPVDIGWHAAQSLASRRTPPSETELVHVAILGPYGRIANRDRSVVEIIDCVHRTVTSFSPRRRAARYDLPQRDFGPPDDFAPLNGPYSGAHITIATRREPDTSIDGAPVERYTSTTDATNLPGAPNRGQHYAFATEWAAIGNVPARSVACAGRDVGPEGFFYAYDWAFANGPDRARPGRLVKAHAHVIQLGPDVPHRFAVAYVAYDRGQTYAVFSGKVRTLSERDAALFAVPSDTRLDQSAPTLVDR